MSTLFLALGLSVLGGLGGLLVAASVLLLKDSARTKIVPELVSYAVGALLGAALLKILPEASEQLPPARLYGTLLVGVMLFFVLEKLVLWRHCHTHDCEVHGGSVVGVIVGDSFHNFIDGAVIATAVMTAVPLGISTAIAVAAHEIPQELGEFAILLHAGYSRGRALLFNVLSGLASAAGALVAFIAFDYVPTLRPYCLALAAASFLYVSMADLIPGLHKGRTDAASMRQIALIGLGILTMLVI